MALRVEANGQVNLKGLVKAVVENEEQALEKLFLGETARTISSHVLNNHSTR